MKYVLDDSAVVADLEAFYHEKATWHKENGPAKRTDDLFQWPLIPSLLDIDAEPFATWALPRVNEHMDELESWPWGKVQTQTYSLLKQQVKKSLAIGINLRVLESVKLDGGYVQVEESIPVIPNSANELLLALLMRRMDLFDRMILLQRKIYKHPELNAYFDLFHFMFHLARDDRDAALAELDKHKERYSTDAARKPQFKELLSGLLTSNEAVFCAGVEKEVKKHEMMWSCKRYTKGPIINRAKPHMAPQFNSRGSLYLEVGRNLVSYKWTQAYLSGALLVWWEHLHGRPVDVKPSRWLECFFKGRSV